jgi:organic hydroperoxide reductase OsmC/OhrA
MSATIHPSPNAAVPGEPSSAPPRESRDFALTLRWFEGYTQIVDFQVEGVPVLATDELTPLGKGRGPNPAQLLGAAVGSCLGASLLFCLAKSHVDVTDLRTVVQGTVVRSAEGRLRIGSIRVSLSPSVRAEDRARVERCRELFEDFCLVTQSVRHGIDVAVEVNA